MGGAKQMHDARGRRRGKKKKEKEIGGGHVRLVCGRRLCDPTCHACFSNNSYKSIRTDGARARRDDIGDQNAFPERSALKIKIG